VSTVLIERRKKKGPLKKTEARAFSSLGRVTWRRRGWLKGGAWNDDPRKISNDGTIESTWRAHGKKRTQIGADVGLKKESNINHALRGRPKGSQGIAGTASAGFEKRTKDLFPKDKKRSSECEGGGGGGPKTTNTNRCGSLKKNSTSRWEMLHEYPAVRRSCRLQKKVDQT